MPGTTTRLSYRFAGRPGWILSHVFVGSCVVAFLWAGFWQKGRLEERRESNAVVLTRTTTEPVPIGEVVSPAATSDQIVAAPYRRVTITGTYRPSSEVLIANHTNGGRPGFWVVTPIVQADGSAVAVNRGWIPLPLGDGGAPSAYAPPPGTVTVTGLVRETQRQEGLAAPDDSEGTLTTMKRVDIPRLGKQLPVPLYPVYVDLITQAPGQTEAVPSPVPAPPLDEGSHFSYMAQWFVFATLTCIVYPLLLRRTARHKAADARERAAAEHDEHAEPADGPGAGPTTAISAAPAELVR